MELKAKMNDKQVFNQILYSADLVKEWILLQIKQMPSHLEIKNKYYILKNEHKKNKKDKVGLSQNKKKSDKTNE